MGRVPASGEADGHGTFACRAQEYRSRSANLVTMERISPPSPSAWPRRSDCVWQTRSLRYLFLTPAIAAVCVGCSLAARWRPLWAGIGGYAAFAGLQLVGFGVLSILERQGRSRATHSAFSG